MPLRGATFDQRSQEDILAFLRAEMRNEFGEDIDFTQSSVFRTFAEAVATVDAEEVEPALEEVYNSAFLESAEGENLEKVVAILGISRRSAQHTTGTVRMDHEGTVDQDYAVDNGTIVQTDADDPIQFETSERVELTLFDDWESGAIGNEYGGQTADFSVVDGSAGGDPSPDEGTYALKADAVSGSKIFTTGTATSVGSTMDFRVYLQDSDNTQNASMANMFGVTDSNNYYRVLLDSNGAHEIEKVAAGSPTDLATSTYSVNENEWLRNRVRWSPENGGTINSQIIDSSGAIIDEIEVTDEEDITEGGYGFEQRGATENVYWDHSGDRSVMADARAVEAGPEGNIGANTLTVFPNVPNGVNSVTNPYPMGDDDHYLTSLLTFTLGLPAETDEELRDRAAVSEGAGGQATVPGIIAAATALPGAESVSVYENKTNTDNTGSGGLPPKSFELVYYGTDDDQDIGEMLHETRAFTARDYGGAHGTAKSYTVDADNGQSFTLEWTEPTTIDVDMTLDIVVDDSFIGKDPLRNRIVNYVGGTRVDGTSTLGTGTGEDVYVDQIEDVVTGPDDTGVIGISSYSFTPSVGTDGNGLEVVSIGANEVAETNAEDSSITINVTQV